MSAWRPKMNSDLENKLFEKYPEIFQQRHLSEVETAMCWGITCGDGWYNIIDSLCAGIMNHVFNANSLLKYKQSKGECLDKEPIKPPQAVQVKEKFGGLRFYLEYSDDYINGLVHMAESMSYKTCEVCGNVGTQNNKGWVTTLCKDCRDKNDRSRTS